MISVLLLNKKLRELPCVVSRVYTRGLYPLLSGIKTVKLAYEWTSQMAKYVEGNTVKGTQQIQNTYLFTSILDMWNNVQ